MTIDVEKVKALCTDAIEHALSRYEPVERSTVLAELLPERELRVDQAGKPMIGKTSIRSDYASEHFASVFESPCVGDCFDPYTKEGDIEWYSMNIKPKVGDIALIHIPGNEKMFEHMTSKVLGSYMGKLIMISRDPPVVFSPRWKLVGTLLAMHRYPEGKRMPVPAEEQALTNKAAAVATAGSYGWNAGYLQRVFGDDFNPNDFIC